MGLRRVCDSHVPRCRARGIVRAAAVLLAALGPIAAFEAVAQIGLPRVELPELPARTPLDVDGAVDAVTSDVARLRELRRLRIRDLLRRHAAVLEADPNGALIVRNEVLAFAPSEAALARARAEGFAIARHRTLEGLDASIVVLRAPAGQATRRALRRLRALDPQGTYDFNHVYAGSGTILPGAPPGAAASAPVTGPGTRRPRIGLIDGGVDVAHPVFADVAIRQHGCGGTPVASAHGTAVASLLVGRSGSFQGAAPDAELYAADVYCGQPTGGAVDAVADALAWLSRERVPVVNVSLVGPPNLMLEQLLRRVLARGHLVVAAVGNDGPAAPPLYPAAYAGVVGVTGVDARQRALLEAGRGRHVDFSAPGADMTAAAVAQPFAPVRGTSFAAPLVAGLLAAELRVPDPAAAEAALVLLKQRAIDLGARGPDSTYGNGLVGEALRVGPRVARAGAE